MKRLIVYTALVGCAVFVTRAERGEAQVFDGACPSIAMTMCDRVDLSEVCGPGCYVDIMGRPTEE